MLLAQVQWFTGAISASAISTGAIRYNVLFYDLLAIYGVLSQSRICRNLRVFGANFFVAIYASVLFKSLFATPILLCVIITKRYKTTSGTLWVVLKPPTEPPQGSL